MLSLAPTMAPGIVGTQQMRVEAQCHRGRAKAWSEWCSKCHSGDRNGVLKTQKKERRVGRGSEWFTEEGIFELDFEGCIGVFHGMEVDVKCVGIGILGRRNNMSEGTEV